MLIVMGSFFKKMLTNLFCVCMEMQGHAYCTAHMWGSEDNSWESVLLGHLVGCQNQIQAIRPGPLPSKLSPQPRVRTLDPQLKESLQSDSKVRGSYPFPCPLNSLPFYYVSELQALGLRPGSDTYQLGDLGQVRRPCFIIPFGCSWSCSLLQGREKTSS